MEPAEVEHHEEGERHADINGNINTGGENPTGNGYHRMLKVGAVVAGGVAGYVAVPFIVTTGLYYLGFTATGVAAGSVAAASQAAVGNVAAGSWFAAFTSLGMTGAAATATTGAATGAAAAGVGASYWPNEGNNQA